MARVLKVRTVATGIALAIANENRSNDDQTATSRRECIKHEGRGVHSSPSSSDWAARADLGWTRTFTPCVESGERPDALRYLGTSGRRVTGATALSWEGCG